MSEIIRARVEERLTRLRLGSVATRLDAILSQAGFAFGNAVFASERSGRH